jgi:hypothetical protein
VAGTVEVLSLDSEGHWKLLDAHGGSEAGARRSFAALELDLALLWADEE